MSSINVDIVESMFDPGCIILPSGEIYFTNDAFCELVRYGKEELIGQHIKKIFPKIYWKEIDEKLENRLFGIKEKYCIWIVDSTGRPIHVDLSVGPVLDKDNSKLLYAFGNLKDMTKERETQRKLETLISIVRGGILETSPDGVVTEANENIIHITGYSREEMKGMSLQKVLQSPIENVRQQILSEDYGGKFGLKEYVTPIICKDGSTKHLAVTLGRFMTSLDELPPGLEIDHTQIVEDGSVKKVHERSWIQVVDVTKEIEDREKYKKLAEENAELAKENEILALKDPLTGLYNQRAFKMFLENKCNNARRYGFPLSLIVIDANNFKFINDKMGHDVGDGFITEIGCFLHDKSRDSDLLFRYGGDEFVALLEKTSLENAHILGKRFIPEFESVFQPVSLSLGITQYIPGEDHSKFLVRADAAMYEAKRLSKQQDNKSRIVFVK